MGVNPEYLLDQFEEYCKNPSDESLRDKLQLLCCCDEEELQENFDTGFESFVRVLSNKSGFVLPYLRKHYLEEIKGNE